MTIRFILRKCAVDLVTVGTVILASVAFGATMGFFCAVNWLKG